MDFKICPKCKNNKPIADFNKNKAQRSGYSSYCRRCAKKLPANLKHQKAYNEKYQERKTYRNRRKSYYGVSKAYNPEAYRQYAAKWNSKTRHLRLISKALTEISLEYLQ